MSGHNPLNSAGSKQDEILHLMSDGLGRTLAEITAVTGAPEPSVSAHLRALRKKENGGHVVNKRRPRAGFAYEYTVIRNATIGS